MAKERTDAEKAEKKERKREKKEKRSEKDGVHKSKKDKKDKKDKIDKGPQIEQAEQQLEPAQQAPESAKLDENPSTNGEVTAALLETLAVEKPPVTEPTKTNGEVAIKPPPLIGALVPFANPLADEKVGKKVLKTVKKAAKNKSLKRGVKEVVKSLRKSHTANQPSLPPFIVILAADISPMDVISHIPVLCEDHNIPYLFVTSRAELGAAGATKRPTSVVMVCRERGGKRKEGEVIEGEEEYGESYKELAKIVERESLGVKV
ncbi:MAG: snoRNA-binding protein [Candelina mexicana]|nr:MAG: snoRNA-binding protein [Candelina mexicana]